MACGLAGFAGKTGVLPLHFTDGSVIGSLGFVDEAFHAARDRYVPKRKDGAKKPRWHSWRAGRHAMGHAGFKKREFECFGSGCMLKVARFSNPHRGFTSHLL